ncbi:MAG: hypothetical protein ACYS1A_06530 [Planctomycetota bacterium]
MDRKSRRGREASAIFFKWFVKRFGVGTGGVVGCGWWWRARPEDIYSLLASSSECGGCRFVWVGSLAGSRWRI